MKKARFIPLLIICVFLIAALCFRIHYGFGLFRFLLFYVTTPNEDNGTTFEASILGISDAWYLVEPVEGSPELNSADRIEVYVGDLPAMEVQILSEEAEVGDVIKITYYGGIMETYPAQLGEVYEVRVIEKAADK